MLNARIEALSDYTFQRLARLVAALEPPPGRPVVDLSLGQPMHPIPALFTETLAAHGHLWGRYPPVLGSTAYREAVAGWLHRRYDLPQDMIDPERHILPVAGTKEALYMVAQVVVPQTKDGRQPAVLLPNPFYNVYLGGAVMAGAEPVLLPVSASSRHLPDLDRLSPELLARTAAFYLCSPANPQGTAADLGYWSRLLELARRHDFVVLADECYSEVYTVAPPVGALQAALASGGDLDGLVIFHSLSKRSNLAGLRSGFVAGDPAVIAAFARLRNYGAAVQPLPVLAAAAALWQDEEHVEASRALYRTKFDIADRCLDGRFGHVRPDGGFFLWLDVGDGETATRRLWAEAGIKVLPGAYLGRPDEAGQNPGDRCIRVALVDRAEAVEAALVELVGTLS